MTQTTHVRAALRRLEAALVSLEAASSRVRSAAEREAQIAVLAEDRSRLAEELDAVSARAASLESVNADVAHRLDHAMETIRAVLSARDT